MADLRQAVDTVSTHSFHLNRDDGHLLITSLGEGDKYKHVVVASFFFYDE